MDASAGHVYQELLQRFDAGTVPVYCMFAPGNSGRHFFPPLFVISQPDRDGNILFHCCGHRIFNPHHLQNRIGMPAPHERPGQGNDRPVERQ